MKAGLIGCGNISDAYLKNAAVFEHLRLVACADIRDEAAKENGLWLEILEHVRDICSGLEAEGKGQEGTQSLLKHYGEV